MAKTIKLTYGYEDSEYQRQYSFEADDTINSADCKAKILAINQSLAAGTDEGLADFFVSDVGERFVKIVDARLVTVSETQVAIGG